MTNEKSKEETLDNLRAKPEQNAPDKKALFSKLFKVQYPMTQEAPSAKEEEPDYSKMGYHEHMDALIEKYKDEL